VLNLLVMKKQMLRRAQLLQPPERVYPFWENTPPRRCHRLRKQLPAPAKARTMARGLGV